MAEEVEESARVKVSKNNLNNFWKNRKEPSLDYFTVTGKTERGLDVYTCTFCSTTLTRKIVRFNEHLLLRCSGITEEAKNDLLARLPGECHRCFKPDLTI